MMTEEKWAIIRESTLKNRKQFGISVFHKAAGLFGDLRINDRYVNKTEILHKKDCQNNR